ncbi:MAG: hypothetical protein IPK04_15885 [Bdellovibrionales bacterium]|nr:hypothetical protein [Bdellovibrionales bacterium]
MFREICINPKEQSPAPYICSKDPVQYLHGGLIQSFKGTLPYSFGNLLPGIALIITFLLIGSAVGHIGESLTGLTNETVTSVVQGQAKDLPSKNRNLSTANLGKAISELKGKFWVSVSGILASILYLLLARLLQRLLSDSLASNLEPLRNRYRLRESIDVELQQKQADGALDTVETAKTISNQIASNHGSVIATIQEVSTKIAKLESIDVKVGDFAETVTHKMENVLNNTVGERLKELMTQQTEFSKVIARSISEALTNSMQESMQQMFAEIAKKLPDVISKGSSEAGDKMAAAVSVFERTLPLLEKSVRDLSEQMRQTTQEAGQQTRQTNQDLLGSIKQAIDAMNFQRELSQQENEKAANHLRQISEQVAKATTEGAATSAKSYETATEHMRNGIISSADELKNVFHNVVQTIRDVDEQSATMLEGTKSILSEVNSSTTGFAVLLRSFDQAQVTMAQTARDLSMVSTDFKTFPEKTLNLVTSIGQVVEYQNQLIEKQKNIWKDGAEAMLEKHRLANDIVDKQVKTTSELLARVTEKLNNGFADAVDELTSEMGALNQNISNFNKKPN